MTWKKVINADPGDADHHGGDSLDKVSDLFSAVDVDDVDINADWIFRSGKLNIRNPANTFSYNIVPAAIAANRTINLPLLTAADTFTFNSFAAILSSKTLDSTCDISAAIGAGSQTTYMVEPTGTNINAPTGYTVRKMFRGSSTTTTYGSTAANIVTMFDDINDQLTRPTASGSGMKGGIIYLKNGTYSTNASFMDFSDTTDAANIHVRLIGESRQNTIIKTHASSGAGTMIDGYCSFDVENIMFDGTSVANIVCIGMHDTGDTNKVLKVKNCSFHDFTRFDVNIVQGVRGIEHCNCYHYSHQGSEDQVAIGTTGGTAATRFAEIYNNTFEKISGVLTGESFTSGTVYNCHVYNNYINRTTPDSGGISIEGFSSGYNNENVFIHDNVLVNAGINIGSSNDFTDTLKNITISGNNLRGGGIRILGTSSGYSGKVKDISVTGNTIVNPYEHGILLYHTGGIIFVKDNVIQNSNISSNDPGNNNGLISLVDTIDPVVEGNTLYLEANADTDVSPWGIKYVNGANVTIRNNRATKRNATTTYQQAGTQTGISEITDNTG